MVASVRGPRERDVCSSMRVLILRSLFWHTGIFIARCKLPSSFQLTRSFEQKVSTHFVLARFQRYLQASCLNADSKTGNFLIRKCKKGGAVELIRRKEWSVLRNASLVQVQSPRLVASPVVGQHDAWLHIFDATSYNLFSVWMWKTMLHAAAC
jgi:hypothetical protein